jgi:hypothetical protein
MSNRLTPRSLPNVKTWFLRTNGWNQRIARISSGAVFVVGCFVLLGWSLNISWLVSLTPGTATMKANTALGFLLAGLSLGFQTRTHPSRFTDRLAKTCAIAVTLIGLLTLCQYLFNWNLSIDQWLFQDNSGASPKPYMGRMGENTALNFALLGLALWLRERRSSRWDVVVQTLTLCSTTIAVLALIGYAYQVQIFYQSVFYSTSMAVHTAIEVE